MLGWKEKKCIEKTVEKLASCRLIQKFYPTFISKEAGYPLAEVFDVLISFVVAKQLILKWEIRCTEYNCYRTIKTFSDVPNDIDTLDCLCGEEIEIARDNIFPVFSFDEEYREYIVEESHKNQEESKKKDVSMKYAQDNAPCSLAELLMAKKLTVPSNMPLGTVINYIVTEKYIVDGQGECCMGDSYKFKDISVNANQSNLVFGVGNSTEGTTIGEIANFQQVTKTFLKELEVIKSDTYYQEITENIQKIANTLSAEQPDKSYISFLKEKVSTIFNTITKPATLITAYGVWIGAFKALAGVMGLF